MKGPKERQGWVGEEERRKERDVCVCVWGGGVGGWRERERVERKGAVSMLPTTFLSIFLSLFPSPFVSPIPTDTHTDTHRHTQTHTHTHTHNLSAFLTQVQEKERERKGWQWGGKN